jgi:hypothetical protein
MKYIRHGGDKWAFLDKTLKPPEKLPDEAWDFRKLPPDEIEPCYLYEYSKESPLIISKITATLKRRRSSESAVAKKRRSTWFKSNPEPTEERDREVWQKKMLSEIGDTVVTTELEQEIHFVVNFAEDRIFPEKHWLEIDPERRRKHAVRGDRRRVGHVDPASMEAKHLLIHPLEYFLELRRLLPIAFLNAKLPGYSGPHIFDVCWARSNRKLKKDFEEWLKNTRPKDQPGFQASAHGGSRRTTRRDLLKALGALRLMRAYKRNVYHARHHTWDVCDKPLYKEQTAWIKAATKAEEHLVIFQRNMLRI